MKALILNYYVGYGIVPSHAKTYHKIPKFLIGEDKAFSLDEVEKGLWCLLYFEGAKNSREVFFTAGEESAILESGPLAWVEIDTKQVVGRESLRIRKQPQEKGDFREIIPYGVSEAPEPSEGETLGKEVGYVRKAPVPTKPSKMHLREFDTIEDSLYDMTPPPQEEETHPAMAKYTEELKLAARNFADFNFVVEGKRIRLKHLPHPFTVLQSRPRSGKTVGLLELLKEAAFMGGRGGKRIVVATTTRQLAAQIYDNLYVVSGESYGDFNERVILHMGRGVGVEERTYNGVKTVYDMNTCNENMIGAVNSVGKQGGNLYAVCGSCPHRYPTNKNDEDILEGENVERQCRYWVTRERYEGGDFQVAITTIGSLEYMKPNFGNAVLILDEMSPKIPTGKITPEGIAKTRQAITKLELVYEKRELPESEKDSIDTNNPPLRLDEYLHFPNLDLLLQKLEGREVDTRNISVDNMEAEIKLLRRGAKGTGVPSRPIIAALGKRYLKMHFGKSSNGGWVFARVPDWGLPVGEGLEVLYADATPSPFMQHLVGKEIEPFYIKKQEDKWPIQVILHQVPISRSMIERTSSADSPQTRYMRIAQAFGLPKDSLWTGIKAAHGSEGFYVWGSRGKSGGEGHDKVSLLASAYSMPSDISVILAHALVGADDKAESTWANQEIGRIPRRLRNNPQHSQKGYSVGYPYPMLVWDGESEYAIAEQVEEKSYPNKNHPARAKGKKLYSANRIVACELLQTIGRAFTPVSFDEEHGAPEEGTKAADTHEGDKAYNSSSSSSSIRVDVIGTVPILGFVEWVSVQRPSDSLSIKGYFDSLGRKLWVAQNVEDNDIERFDPPLVEFFVLKKGGQV
jgi:hypothetical protein